MKTCFVIIGYGEKVDPFSQRRINLDRVFENVIKPAFESFSEPKFDCFRACDKNYSGIIDSQMYKWIMEADFVIADISTLNPNAIYELGIRHALRPYSTLVIAEDGIREFPFDISHVKIEKYKHLGEDIGVAESKRIIKILVSKIQNMLDDQIFDSPVYTYIPKLKPPFIDADEPVSNNKEIKLESNKVSNNRNVQISLTELITRAEAEMKTNNYKDAIRHFKEASTRDKQNIYLKYKMILATYKSEIPDKEGALIRAKNLLEKYFIIKRNIDRNVLELSGNIYYYLAEIEYEKATLQSYRNAKIYAKKSNISFNKAYVIADDLVMGSNYGYVLLIEAIVEDDMYKKYRLFTQSLLVWQRIYNKFIALDNIKKEKHANSKPNSIFLEKILLAMIVLNKSQTWKDFEKIKSDLIQIQEAGESKLFQEKIEKISKYTNTLRSSLANYHPDAFL